jgi:hypothetical protein
LQPPFPANFYLQQLLLQYSYNDGHDLLSRETARVEKMQLIQAVLRPVKVSWWH